MSSTGAPSQGTGDPDRDLVSAVPAAATVQAERGIFAASFFDAPGLLAVRFSRQQDELASYVANRKPDTGGGGCLGGLGGIIGAGMVVTVLATCMVRGCPTETASTRPTIPGAVATDCLRSSDWRRGLENLGDEFQPLRPELRPWAVRTLLDIPRDLARRGDATGGWLRPRCTPEDEQAFIQGSRLAEELSLAGAGSDLAVIVDLPGPAAVAVAAAMAGDCQPVFTFDNLPHPQGVVPAAETLAALVYRRPAFAAARERCRQDAPPLFVLEGRRLAAYANEVERFDNRSCARLPDVEGFRSLGVRHVLYVRQKSSEIAEADDLNTLFLQCATAGIDVRYAALESLVAMSQGGPEPERQPQSAHHPWLWSQYGWYRPAGMPDPEPAAGDARYRTVPRLTQFSPGMALDGGQHARASVIDRLAMPPPAPSKGSSSGGSWFRSFSSSSG